MIGFGYSCFMRRCVHVSYFNHAGYDWLLIRLLNADVMFKNRLPYLS